MRVQSPYVYAGEDSALGKRISKHLNAVPEFELVYSYYEDGDGSNGINDTNLWTGGGVNRKPNLEFIYRVAPDLRTEVVVMAWLKYMGQRIALDDIPMTLYIVDLKRQTVIQDEAKVKSLSTLLNRLKSEYLATSGH